MTMRDKRLKIAIVSGPTGGHFFPALAIGEGIVKEEGVAVQFFVPFRRYLTVWLERKRFEYRIIPEARFSCRNVLFPARFIYAFFRSCLYLAEGKFDGVVITGSYVTVPFLLAAKLYGLKIFVHEQNYLPGKVTKLSRFIAGRIAVSFPFLSNLPRNRTFVTGFPIVSDFKRRFHREELLEEFGLSQDYTTVLILGGSQGAVFINELIMENLGCFKGKKIQFIHLAGSQKEGLADRYHRHKIQAMVFDFYFDMARLYTVADIVICRAGAGTLAEISEWNLPAIVIPYPYAGGHQRYNAMYFAERKSCIMLEQNSTGFKKFPELFERMMNEMGTIKRNLRQTSISDVNGDNVKRILEFLN